MITLPSGLYFIDGADLALTYNIFVEDGSADFLKYPARKQTIEHDWKDSNGIDVDLSRIFLKERTGTLNVVIVTETEADYFTKHTAFITQLAQPGLRRLQVTAHGQRSYYLCYQDCTAYKQIIPLKGSDMEGMIVHRFSIQLMEPEPKLDASDVFIVDENGRFLIT